mgnify:CR=1 FL=1
MKACVLPVWLYCLSDFCCCCRSCCPLFVWFLFGAWSSHIIFPLSVFASTHVLYYFPTLCVCIHSRLCPLCICVNSACVGPACLCHFDLSLSFVGVSANSACAHSLCLCELAVFVPTQSFCTLCDFLPTLCLCAHDVSLPTLLLSFCSLGCPFCLAVLFMSLLCLCFCCPLSD